jgi:hypothetical protein
MRLWSCGLVACALFAQPVSFDAAAIKPSETYAGGPKCLGARLTSKRRQDQVMC